MAGVVVYVYAYDTSVMVVLGEEGEVDGEDDEESEGSEEGDDDVDSDGERFDFDGDLDERKRY